MDEDSEHEIAGRYELVMFFGDTHRRPEQIVIIRRPRRLRGELPLSGNHLIKGILDHAAERDGLVFEELVMVVANPDLSRWHLYIPYVCQ